jgi:HK97 family phage prohead protease
MPAATEAEWVTRFLPYRSAKVQVSDAGALGGMPIVFNSRSQDLGGFFEVVAPTALDRVLRSGSNIRLLADHRKDTSSVLADTRTGMMRVRKESDGIHINANPPDTTDARDLTTKIKAGLVEGMSFAFRVAPNGQTWEELADGSLLRTLLDIDVSARASCGVDSGAG